MKTEGTMGGTKRKDTDHLTTDDRATLLRILDASGADEVLRLVGQYVANQHPDMHVGTDLRKEINLLANKVRS